MTAQKDWKKWHGYYDDNGSSLAKRLRLVQGAISSTLPDELESTYQIIDICSGDGRDLIEVLSQYPSKNQVHSYLVEIDPRLAEESKKAATASSVPNVDVATGDASLMRIYKDVFPADLILLCGIFGNVSNEDVTSMIRALPQLSQKGTKVIWTRNMRSPEFTLEIRDLFVAAGFGEIAFQLTSDNSYAVGIYEYTGVAQPLDEDLRLFTFLK